MFASAGEIFSSEENPQCQENGSGALQVRKSLLNRRLWGKPEIAQTHRDIVWSVSHFSPNSLRKSATAFYRTFLG